MKIKKLPFFAGLLAVGLLFGCCMEKGYTLKGSIGGDADGKAVYLYSGLGPFFTPESIVDSTVIANGAFEFKEEVAHPDVYTLKFFDDDSRSSTTTQGYVFRPLIPLYLSSGTVTVEVAFDSIPLDRLTMGGLNYDYSKIKVSGPADFTLFMDYARGKIAVLSGLDAINRDYGRIYRSHDMAERVSFVERVGAAEKKVKEYAVDFITRNAGNNVGLWVFGDNLDRLSAGEIARFSALFPPKIKSGSLGEKILAQADRIGKTAVGAPFVDHSFEDKDGNPVKLSDHLEKGRYVLLEFWASWCGPCRADIPHLKEVYALYHPEGFEIISISMDTDKAAWLKAVEAEQMSWLQISDMKAFTSDLAKIYNFSGIPACVLVGPDGKVAHRNFRGPRMDKGLIDLFGNRFGQ